MLSLSIAVALMPCVFGQQLRVAAASDLAPVMKRLVPAFEQAGGLNVEVEVTAGSSGSLFTQIMNGAPYDVFLSADVDYARKLESAGAAEPGSLRHYAQGRLVLVVRHGVPGS